MHILDTIDRAINGDCPCGAPPRPGSLYCGIDCEPTHIARDTDTRQTGHYATPMRWRPDLVTAADDTALVPITAVHAANTVAIREGRYNAQVFKRADPTVWHLRLDDGHRFVGCDLTDMDADDGAISTEQVARIHDTWRRLERQLTDPDQVELPPPDLRPALLRDVPREVQETWEWWCDTCRRPLPTVRWHGPISYHLLDDYSTFHRIHRRAGSDDAAYLLWLARERRRQADQQQGAARAALGIPAWERRCRECHRHGAPLAGVRVAGSPRLVGNGRGTAVVALETIQLCPHCRAPYPGPMLVMTAERSAARQEWHYRLRTAVGNRRYGYDMVVLESRLEAAHDPAAYMRREWDRMETQLLRRIADDEAAGLLRQIEAAQEAGPEAHTAARHHTVGTLLGSFDPANLTDPAVWTLLGTIPGDGFVSTVTS
ncbi:hypothetical protein [Micromonospora sp. WMMD737]|uniref:hypothetical protein n=1 Tax=Micromonospora sp. WMMD737 TaxID=3404113 RepID=UPI003B94A548